VVFVFVVKSSCLTSALGVTVLRMHVSIPETFSFFLDERTDKRCMYNLTNFYFQIVCIHKQIKL
jgi:hypothetical protein